MQRPDTAHCLYFVDTICRNRTRSAHCRCRLHDVGETVFFYFVGGGVPTTGGRVPTIHRCTTATRRRFTNQLRLGGDQLPPIGHHPTLAVKSEAILGSDDGGCIGLSGFLLLFSVAFLSLQVCNC